MRKTLLMLAMALVLSTRVMVLAQNRTAKVAIRTAKAATAIRMAKAPLLFPSLQRSCWSRRAGAQPH